MKEYFSLDLALLQEAAAWAAGPVDRAIVIYEGHFPEDKRPRRAWEEGQEFSSTGRRTGIIRKLAMDAYRASRESSIPAASYAANAASLFAAMAYTHPFRDLRQAEHLLGPIVFSALAEELEHREAERANAEIATGIAAASERVRGLLREYPPRERGRSRKDELFFALDRGLRSGLPPS